MIVVFHTAREIPVIVAGTAVVFLLIGYIFGRIDREVAREEKRARMQIQQSGRSR